MNDAADAVRRATAVARVRTLAACATAALLAACSTTEPPPKDPKRAHRDWLGDIRAEAAKLDSAVEVAPLSDPAVEDLKAQARRKEEAKDYAGAAELVKQAVALRAEDPALWQWWSELALMQNDFAVAEQRAVHAYDLGPKVGGLCARAWLAIAIARTERKLAQDAASARAQVASCQVAPPVRM